MKSAGLVLYIDTAEALHQLGQKMGIEDEDTSPYIVDPRDPYTVHKLIHTALPHVRLFSFMRRTMDISHEML